MSTFSLQRCIDFLEQDAEFSYLRGAVDYVELPRLDLKYYELGQEESDDDEDPWRKCFFDMEQPKDPQPRSDLSSKLAVKKHQPFGDLGAGVTPGAPEDISSYGKYYGVDQVDSDSDSETEDGEMSLPYGSRALSSFPGHQVALLPDRTILKSGKSITFNEIMAIKVAERLCLPVPRLYEQNWQQYYRYHDNGQISIRMEYIRGKTLLQHWPQMSTEQKIKVMGGLCTILEYMQLAFPTSGRVIGSCDGSEVRDGRIEYTHFGPACCNEHQFNDYLLSTCAYAPEHEWDAYRRRLPEDSAIAFCHNDIAPDNIILDKKLNVIGLVDWEDAGYYPAYWEYVKFFARPPMVPDWHDYAQYLFPKRYKEELGLFRSMAKWRAP